ncbi:FMN-binding protein MioC [Pasteurellaceae bacterium HPA106]|uniref:FMN-binding protein MioC n=1 Tax=Spirabiliibacterium pneumoniae TaxID=221400 RepID=UPI001AACA13D|nr:FMN-binding protein MioC [Spirabiliibacterium pneumoniae]MBE2896825.1 FMN-binding protein MioC [Spirabiliibacterium pneumoniae]
MEKSVCIISGSTLGGAEYVAEHCEGILNQAGIKTALCHGAQEAQNEAHHHDVWLFVSSTHGAGDLPDNLMPFFDDLHVPEGLQFGVIGLGNSDYDTFCFAVDKIETALLAQGAKLLCPSLKIDVLQTHDPESEAQEWLPTLITAL